MVALDRRKMMVCKYNWIMGALARRKNCKTKISRII